MVFQLYVLRSKAKVKTKTDAEVLRLWHPLVLKKNPSYMITTSYCSCV